MGFDAAVITVYIILINLIGIRYSKAGNMGDYFLGSRSIHWLPASFSIVATETSTLTFISIPGLAYIKGMGFMQITLGYLLGRILVALLLLPGYFKGNIQTVYEFLQERFGVSSRKILSVVFHITRLLADSVRLFATAIPLAVLTGLDFGVSIIIIGAATFIYTYYGGIRSVVIVDSVQLVLYILCALICLVLIPKLMGKSFTDVFSLIPPERMKMLFTGFEEGGSVMKSYNIFSGVIGGLFLSFASHGTDHLIVQRVLSCRDLKSAKKAMVSSGIAVMFQFFLFLLVGLFIMVFLENRNFSKPDEIMPFFIIAHLPDGLRGLMLAGIFAAAMSTLSSSINSLSASTAMDLLGINKKDFSDAKKIRISRMISLLWTFVIILISTLLTDTGNPLVELGLAIASVTYGGILGIFILGRFFPSLGEKPAIAGSLSGIGITALVAFSGKVFWPWYVPIGSSITLIFGIVISRLWRYFPIGILKQK
jgi:SSS family transporter